MSNIDPKFIGANDAKTDGEDNFMFRWDSPEVSNFGIYKEVPGSGYITKVGGGSIILAPNLPNEMRLQIIYAKQILPPAARALLPVIPSQTHRDIFEMRVRTFLSTLCQIMNAPEEKVPHSASPYFFDMTGDTYHIYLRNSFAIRQLLSLTFEKAGERTKEMAFRCIQATCYQMSKLDGPIVSAFVQKKNPDCPKP